VANLFWFDGPGPGRIGVMARPDDEEIPELRAAGVTALVSCLEASEIELYGQVNEPRLCAANGVDFLHFPIRDHTAPRDLASTSDLVRTLAARYREGASIIVHCLAGIGRSPTIAGATLLTLGVGLPDVLRRMAEGRGYPVPEAAEQRDWLEARWLDMLIFNKRIIEGIQLLSSRARLDLIRAKELFERRYEELRAEAPERFTNAHEEYWENFYS
jgi:protein-tyrosine phosphatase